MHQLTAQKERAAPQPQFAALSIDTQPTASSRSPDPSNDSSQLQAEFARYGLSLCQLQGAEMAVSGPGFLARMLPDHRAARVLLRQLQGVA